MTLSNADCTLFAVFGNPVGHSLSPLMHQAALDRLGLKALYAPFCVTHLKEAVQGIRGLDIRGVSVTLPFKTEVMHYLDEVEECARRIGAVNTIWNDQGTLKGYNTDWLGFIVSLKAVTEIKGKRFVVIGAGGAARGIVYGLTREGGQAIIVNRNLPRAEALGGEFDCPFLAPSELEKVTADGLINTTPLGMAPDVDRSPWPRDLLKQFPLVMDIIYNPLKTRLLKEAREVGCRTISGLEMFVHQGAEQLKLWTGLEPPRSHMREVVLAKLSENHEN